MKRTTFIRTLCLLLALTCIMPLAASCKKQKNESTTTTTTSKPKKDFNDFLYSGETVKLYGSDLSPVIYVDPSDYKQSVRAVGDLVKDFERVTGKKPRLVNDKAELAGAELAIIIGTLGKSSLVTSLEAEGYISLDAIKDQWEAYSLSVVENLTDNIKKAVVVAGSDKRGTVYGTYEISELIGVSPWYYWGDVEIEHKDEIILPIEKLKVTEMPDVQYRGIFINDEENLAQWSKQFIGKGALAGTPNSKVYATIFELLLRLKANTLWPAMHACSDPFNEHKNPKTGVSYNAELADDYGIVMSSSHCELLLRDNEGEWQDWCIENHEKYGMIKNENWRKSYDFTINSKGMIAYWEERVAENYLFENIYMIGLRGVHDSSVNCSALKNPTTADKAKVVKAAVEAQLAILEKYEKKYEEETGEAIKFKTAYCPYKEAADYLNYDISLPEDCLLIYSDDNNGYMRTLPNEASAAKYGGFGAYYHVSVWGCPTSYLWMCHTPLTTIAEEMRRTYYNGTDDCWILNVGDIKPAEFHTDYFLTLAWDVESNTEQNTEKFSAEFLQYNFGLDAKTAASFASDLTELYQMMRNYYPESIDTFTDMYNDVYSVVEYGNEGLIVLDRLEEIYNRSLALMNSLDKEKKDSFYQMFHYTVYSYMLCIEKHVYKEMNHLYFNQGRYAVANAYADLAERAFELILEEVDYYNKTMSGGKWNRIMNPYNTDVPVPLGAPEVRRAPTSSLRDTLGVFAEGEADLSVTAELAFGSLNDDRRFIDVFTFSGKDTDFAISAPSYVKITDSKGSPLPFTVSGDNVIYTGVAGLEERLFVSIDWERFSKGETKEGLLILTDSNNSGKEIKIKATMHALDPNTESTKGYYEENGLVSIEAEHFTSSVAQGGFEWKEIDGLGRSGGVMMALSTSENAYLNTRVSNESIKSSAPYLEYKVYFTNTGSYEGVIYRLPGLDEKANARNTCSVGWTVDDSAVHIKNCVCVADDRESSPWGNMIKMHIEKLSFTLEITESGWHTFRVYMVNSLLAFDKIVLRANECSPTRLDAPETFNTVSWERVPIAALPEYTFSDSGEEDGSYKYNVLYDATNGSAPLQSGYSSLDTGKGILEGKGWEWESTAGLNGYYREDVSKFPNVDKTFIASSRDNTLKLLLATPGRYGFTVTVGDPAGTVSTKDMKVECNGKTVLEGINVSGKRVYHYSFVAEAGEDCTVTLTFSGDWMIGSLEIFSYTPVQKTGSGAYTAGSKGIVAIEVEDACEGSEYAYTEGSSDGKGASWSKVSGVCGEAMFSGPNAGQSYSSADPASSPAHKMHFKTELKAGEYTVYALIKSSGGDDDSVFVSLNGQKAINLNLVDETNGFAWAEIGKITCTKTGESILTLMGREDGIVIDRIILCPSGVKVDYETPSIRK